MAPDFKDMASRLKASHEQRMTDHDHQRADEREERATVVEAGVSLLRTDVLPLLREAQISFAEEGIEARISEDFDVANYTSRKPSVSFVCLGPKRGSDGWQFEAKAVFFDSDGEAIFITASTDHYTNRHGGGRNETVGRFTTGEGEALIVEAIERSVTSYYEQLEELKRSGAMRI